MKYRKATYPSNLSDSDRKAAVQAFRELTDTDLIPADCIYFDDGETYGTVSVFDEPDEFDEPDGIGFNMRDADPFDYIRDDADTFREMDR